VDPEAPLKPAYVWKTQVSKKESVLPAGMVRIKLLHKNGEWVLSDPLKLQGKRKRLPLDGSMPMSPSLMQRGSKVWLGCPVELRPPRFISNNEFKMSTDGKAHRVCAIDVGINTAATAVIVDSTGTVIARKFLTCGRHNDQRDRLQAVIRFKQKKSGGTVKGVPFCTELHRRIEGLSKDAARQLASSIAAFAAAHGATVLVIEDLKGWRPKGPSRAMRARFHRLQHRMLVSALTHKAQELGMRLLEIHARGTSRYAYDGSGVVVRAKENAQNATFSNGRQYNADLNAASNIAARGLAMILGIKNPREESKDVKKDVKIKEAETGKSSGTVSRMPIVLSDVWAHHKFQNLVASKPLGGASNPASQAVVCQQ
jgi:putative transposase